MKWNEFKKEWQELEKSRKIELIRVCIALCISACIMIFGIDLWAEYSKELLDDSLKFAFVGILTFSVGQFLFNYICYTMLRDRIRRLEDEEEALH